MAHYKIGIDIGGTRTHAVLLEDEQIVISIDVLTSPDVRQCVTEALTSILSKASADSIAITANDITAVMIGTTRFVNNIIQQKNLNKVFAIRLGAPATTAISPASDWPDSLKGLIGEHHAIIDGGYEFTGKEISALDPEQVKSLAQKVVQLGIQAISVAGVFSRINPDQEQEVYSILKAVNPDFSITLSHQIGDLGFLARENASILNAALSAAFESFCKGIQQALIDSNLLKARLFLSSNNGTIENMAAIFPVQTYGSGPSNSIRGAAQLYASETPFFLVADVGGTTTDIGINCNGFPVPAGTEIKIGDESEGFLCNFPSPLTFSCALGGGTIISEQNGDVIIGPESVGHALQSRAIGFGGDVLTVTDIAIATGRLKHFGNPEAIAEKNISRTLLERADDAIHQKLAAMINSAIPYVNTEQRFPVVIVGGGAELFDLDRLKLFLNKSVDKIIMPAYASCANAIGASVAKVSGQFRKIYQYEDTLEATGISRNDAIEDARQRAIADAVDKGANPDTIKELGVTETPLSYLPGALHCIKFEVIGDYQNKIYPVERYVTDDTLLPAGSGQEHGTVQSDIIHQNRVEAIEKQGFEDMASGAAILGSGGGGDTYLSTLLLFNFLKKGIAPKIIELEQVTDEMNLVAIYAMGAPSVGNEKLFSSDELVQVINVFEQAFGYKIDALIPGEGGGFNAIYPLSVAAANNLPIINADCMGRAFPELQMTTPNIYGGDLIAPVAVLSNGKEAHVIQAADPKSLEAQARAMVTALGGSVTMAGMPMKGKQAKSWCIPNTLSFCRNLGEAIRTSMPYNRVHALSRACINTGYGPIVSIGAGQIIELNRNCEGGFNKGWLIIESPTHETIKIEFQNENLRATNCMTNHVLAMVPDIITLLDIKGKAIPCELLRVGLEVASIVIIEPPAILKTPQALAVIGPDQFHLPRIRHVRSRSGITFHCLPDQSSVPESMDNRMAPESSHGLNSGICL